MIVFGHNNFLIKRILPSAIGMADSEDTKGIVFEVRQHYFHLFFIPFFGIGKIYAFRRAGDPNLYQMPEQVKMVVQHKYPDIKTPWYTFALPLIGLVVLVGYLASEKLSSIESDAQFSNSVVEKRGYIQYPTTGDYYKLTLSDKDQSYESQSDLFLKVEKYDDENVHVVSLYPSLNQKSDYSMDMDNAIEAFDTAARFQYNAMPIPKKLLLAAVDSISTQPPVYFDAIDRYIMIETLRRRTLETDR